MRGRPRHRALPGALVMFALLLALSWWWIRVGGDGWFYMAIGRWIHQTGSLPSDNPFAFTTPVAHWYPQKWLAFLVTYLLQHITGLGGVVWSFSAISAGALTLCWLSAFERSRASLISASLCVLGLAAVSWRLSVRGETLALLLLAFTVWILGRYRSRGGRTRLIYLLVPTAALWANLHGSFLLAAILPAVVAVGEAVKRVIKSPGTPMGTEDILRLGAVSLLCFMAMLAHPEGPSVIRHVLWQMGALHRVVDIWRPLDVQYTADRWALLYVTAVVAGIALSRRRLDLVDILLLAPFGVEAFVSKRFVDPFVILSIPVASRHWALACRTLKNGATGSSWIKRSLGHAFVGSLAAGCLALGPSMDHFPVASQARGALDYLLAAKPKGHLFNYYTWGGYVMWRGYPGLRVFIDGRDELYSNGVFEDYLKIIGAVPGWEDILEMYEVKWVLIPRGPGLETSLRESPNWQPAYEGPHAVVFRRAPQTSSSRIE